MANTKITDLTAYTDPVSTDVLPIVDVGADITKKVSIADIMENAGSGTEATPGISFDGDPDTGIYRPGANSVAFSTGGTARFTATTTALTAAIPVDVLLGSASTPSYTFTGDLNTGIYSPGADQVAISTNGTGRLFVNSSGQVGVGATPASVDFEVSQSGTSSASDVLRIYNRTDGTGTGYLGFPKYGSTASAYGPYSANNVGINAAFTQLNVGTETSHALVAYTNNSERLRITSDGKLGLGTSSPAELLHVKASGNYGVIVADNSNATGGGRFAAYQNGSLKGIFGVSGSIEGNTTSDAGLFAETGGAIRFYTNGSPTAEAILDSSGRLGIGATPGHKLHVKGTASGQEILCIDNSTASPATNAIRFTCNNNASWADAAYYAQTHRWFSSGNGSEHMRLDASGRLLVGTSTAASTQDGNIQVLTAACVRRNVNTAGGPALRLEKTRGTVDGDYTTVSSGDVIGEVQFYGSNGTELLEAASISAVVDGAPGAADMPGAIVLSTSPDGTAVPTEAFRITNDNVICYIQLDPISKAAAATLTVAELKNGIIRYTGAAATLTLPTGTLMDGGFSNPPLNLTFEWSVVNTGTGTATIAAGTGHTIIGVATVPLSTAGRFATRRTAANTYVSYRISS